MAIDANTLAENMREQFNIMMGNMFAFDSEDMAGYNKCYASVFSDGITASYMASTFFAQFTAEMLVGMLSSNPFRKFLIKALDDEMAIINEPLRYWEPTMEENRFGIQGRDYTNDTKDLLAMMNVTYDKIATLNAWFGTEEGKKEFSSYCLSRKAVRDIKRIACEYPYLIRKYDHDKDFAGEIMEYAGIISKQILQSAGE